MQDDDAGKERGTDGAREELGLEAATDLDLAREPPFPFLFLQEQQRSDRRSEAEETLALCAHFRAPAPNAYKSARGQACQIAPVGAKLPHEVRQRVLCAVVSGEHRVGRAVVTSRETADEFLVPVTDTKSLCTEGGADTHSHPRDGRHKEQRRSDKRNSGNLLAPQTPCEALPPSHRRYGRSEGPPEGGRARS